MLQVRSLSNEIPSINKSILVKNDSAKNVILEYDMKTEAKILEQKRNVRVNIVFSNMNFKNFQLRHNLTFSSYSKCTSSSHITKS